MIKREHFDVLVRELLDPVLVQRHGFEFVRAGYARELRTLLRQSVGFDLDKDTRDVFRVTFGLNSRIVAAELPADESGAYFIQWLTKGGIVDFPRNWPCHNVPTTLRSLKKIEELLDLHLIPWLARHQSLSSFATLLPSGYEDVRDQLLEEERRLSKQLRR